MSQQETGLEIAVIGLSGRFPGAGNIDEFWHNLKSGVESISFFTIDELREEGIDEALLQDPDYVPAYGALEGIDQFDAPFFGYTPAEARSMDPQIRIFHECVWQTLENAGYPPGTGSLSIGLYAGAAPNFPWEIQSFLRDPGSMDIYSLPLLNDKDYLATRVSYTLALKGPSFTVATACSTSLVAIDLAVRGLLMGQCDIAVAGGVTISQKKSGYLYKEGLTFSPDGHCRAFDRQAAGTIFGDGAAAVALKVLEEAREDRDYIYAIIKGTAINNDGKRKAGYTAPGIQGQVDVIRAAQRMAGVPADSIGLIEGHGTATPLGDPIEVRALKTAFNSQKRQYCALGSVKTNVGHLNAASGVTGFIKAVLALNNRLIPPSLHFESPNEQINFADSPFYVSTAPRPWENNGVPLRAGVSSFGVGGTNAHVVLEEAPAMRREPPTGEYHLIIQSAKTAPSLRQSRLELAGHINRHPAIDIGDMAYTLQMGRIHFKHRSMCVCRSAQEAAERLAADDPRSVKSHSLQDSPQHVVFLFPGLGAQYRGMGRELYQTEPTFRDAMDRCFTIVRRRSGLDLKTSIYPPDTEHTTPADNTTDFLWAQLAVFSFEYAMSSLLTHWGVQPTALMGYSFGEYTAACVAGVLSPEEALDIIIFRGQAIGRIPGGAMLSVPLPRRELEQYDDIAIAIDNGESCVVAGTEAAIQSFEQTMKARRVMCVAVQDSYALHSPMMSGIAKELADKIREFRLQAPRVPYIANGTGAWITAEQAKDPDYWARHLQETVQFDKGVQLLIERENTVFIEVGPGNDLTALVQRRLRKEKNQLIINTAPPGERKISDLYYLLNRVGLLWLNGVTIDWDAFHGNQKPFRIPLPSYSFQRKRYWIEGRAEDIAKGVLPSGAQAGKVYDRAQWFYLPYWKQSQPVTPTKNPPSNWLIFLDNNGLGEALRRRLKGDGHGVAVVKIGEQTSIPHGDSHEYTINPDDSSAYTDLFERLIQKNLSPENMIHLWNHTTGEQPQSSSNQGFFSLLNIARGIRHVNLPGNIRIGVVANHLYKISGDEHLHPEKSTLLGPITVIPQEFPNIRCCAIDILRLDESSTHDYAGMILKEFSLCPGGFGDQAVAYRTKRRWVLRYENIQAPGPDQGLRRLKERGVYLITGGLGNVGYILAEYLAEAKKARLVLVGRTPIPPKDQWPRILAGGGETKEATLIARIQKLESLGAEVWTISSDVSNQAEMREQVAAVESQWGPINGIVHGAGIVDEHALGAIEQLSATAIDNQFKAKCRGVEALDRIFAGRNLDFRVLMSSISSILGGLGYAAYSAANLFLDAFALHSEPPAGDQWLSINWDTWQTWGSNQPDTPLGKTLMELSMTPQEGIDTFLSVLAMENTCRMVVSTGDLDTRIRQWIKLEPPADSPEEELDQQDPSTFDSRPELLTPYKAPEGETEEVLAGIWRQTLGFEEVGVEDDFFELGGDSLRAVTIVSRIHQQLDVEVPLAVIFKQPTVKHLANYIDGAQKKLHIPIEPVESREHYPLSAAQNRLFILHQMDKQSMSYNIPFVAELEGNLDIQRLNRTFNAIIERHEILRTSFHVINGSPVQKIHESVNFNVENTTNTVQEFIRPFDLSSAPLLRVGLTERGKDRHLLIMDMHHIITDGSSTGVLVQEIMSLYEGGDPPSLPLQYKDYAGWQAGGQSESVIAGQKLFWKNEFPDSHIPGLTLPTDFKRPEVQTFTGSFIDFSSGQTEYQKLKHLGAEHKASLFMILLAAYYILLARLSGQEEIVVGTPVEGRRHADLKPLIGMFVNTMALRNSVPGHESFLDFLERLKQHTLQAFENQEYQFETLVEEIAPPRDTSRNPMFDVVFVLQNVEIPPIEIRGLNLQPLNHDSGISKFDLTLRAVELENELSLTFEYSSQLFTQETIQSFAGYYKRIIGSIVEHPERKIYELDILSQEEKQRLLQEISGPAVDYPRDKTIQELFEHQVTVHPNGAALKCAETDETVTYRQLNEAAEALAAELCRLGATAGSITPIIDSPSPSMLTAILGILKAGCAYLPIDPNYPGGRIQYMIQDSNAGIVVSPLPLPEDAAAGPIIRVDPLNIPPATEQQQSNPTTPASAAYVIYTSGTTGRPKGVVIEHRHVVRLFFNDGFQFDFSESDVWTLFHSYCFDFSVWEIFGALLYGGTLLLFPRTVSRDPGQYLKILKSNGATILNQTPSAFQNLMHEELKAPDNRLGLRYIIFGGEALHPGMLKPWTKKYPDTTLVNMYGITETTVHVTYKQITEQDIDSHKSNIGTPIPTLAGYVVDRHLNPQPDGLAGELLVGGDGVGRGYLNRPDLTAEKFIPNPFKEQEDEILYRSGDLVKRLPGSGDMEYMGRIDRQVKIRGFRIETAEIEQQMLQHPRIDRAKVTVYNKRAGATDLCAYYTSANGTSLPAADIKEYLGAFLPDFMVPAFITPIEEFPLTANGKIDYSKLPEPEVQLNTTFEAPQGDIQQKIADSWRHTLKLPRVGVHDNFFEVGGNSLDIITINNRLKEAFNLEIPVVAMFRYPTIHSLSEYIAGQGPEEAFTPAAGIGTLKNKMNKTLNIIKR